MPTAREAADDAANDGPSGPVGDQSAHDTAPATEPASTTTAPDGDQAQDDPNLDAAKAQAKQDNDARIENPNEPVTREANPEFGGEGFGYGQKEQPQE